MSSTASGATTRAAPVVEGLFTWPADSPQLIGGHCPSCGVYWFPRAMVTHSPTCPGRKAEQALLSRRGTLWSFTIQHYQPPPPFVAPQPFQPFAIGLVELPEKIKVLGQVTGCRLEDVKIGMAVELVVEPLYRDEQGCERLAWRFRPVAGGGR